MRTKVMVAAQTASAMACGLSLLGISVAQPVVASAETPGAATRHEKLEHVLLVSVDGMHQSDLAWFVQTHPGSTLAALMARGVDYADASTPFPSDSFPGMVGQVTGGNPSTTGIYYDDTWNHNVFPAGTTNCAGPVAGGEVTYFEALDLNLGALDAGQGIVPASGSDPWANILQMTRNPLDVISPSQLPVDPRTCKPIYPSQYLKVNTIFEALGIVNAKCAGLDFTMGLEGVRVVLVKREFSSDGGELLAYLPKWQDRQIRLLPC